VRHDQPGEIRLGFVSRSRPEGDSRCSGHVLSVG
jgi:hypothetical protein